MTDGYKIGAVVEINTSLPLRKILDVLDRLDISSDAKALLMDLARFTVKVGEVVLQVGRKILSLVSEIVARFPNTTFGVVVSVSVGLLVASLPLVAGLAPIATALLLIFGLTKGMIKDLENAQWTTQIRALEERLLQVGASART